MKSWETAIGINGTVVASIISTDVKFFGVSSQNFPFSASLWNHGGVLTNQAIYVLWNHKINVHFEGFTGKYAVLSRIKIFYAFCMSGYWPNWFTNQWHASPSEWDTSRPDRPIPYFSFLYLSAGWRWFYGKFELIRIQEHIDRQIHTCQRSIKRSGCSKHVHVSNYILVWSPSKAITRAQVHTSTFMERL